MDFSAKREQLVAGLIEEGILKTKEIIAAFRRVKRENFVLSQYKNQAYVDEPLPLVAGQTISQPYTVAAMTEALQPKAGQKILEIGAGSGYQAAILSEIAGPKGRVVTVERIKELVDFAAKNLRGEGYANVVVIEGDGTLGFEKYAQYDRIIVTASAPDIPGPLINQLKESGKMVIPVDDQLFLVEKKKGKAEKAFLGYYVFVPLVGKCGHGY